MREHLSKGLGFDRADRDTNVRRIGYVAVENGFAGRTMGALSVTHDIHYREPFMPLIGPVTFVNPEKPETLIAAVDETTAAIIAELLKAAGR